MTLDEVTLDPPWAVRMFIDRAVNEHVETPVQYAFDGTWPVNLTEREAQEVYTAVQMARPNMSNPRGQAHKDLAERHVKEQLVLAE